MQSWNFMVGLFKGGIRGADEALDMYNEMKRRGVAADGVSYNILLAGCVEAGFWGRGRWLLWEMRRRA